MWYTPVSGIWQSVWVESVPEHYIKSLKITTGLVNAIIEIDSDMKLSKMENPKIEVSLQILDNTVLFVSTEKRIVIDMSNITFEDGTKHEPILWSPEQPHLYYFQVKVEEDIVESYFALRKIEIKMCNGKEKIFLNNEPIFFHMLNGCKITLIRLMLLIILMGK